MMRVGVAAFMLGAALVGGAAHAADRSEPGTFVQDPPDARAPGPKGHGGESVPPPRVVVPTIAIDAAPGRAWRVTWRAPGDLRELVFPRSTDDSRVRTWRAPADFELTYAAGAVRLRRRDAASFRSVTVEVPAAYRVLPDDYAPFAPFGDGGMLFHTGRLFACGGDCPDDARWNVTLAFERWRRALVDGALHRSPVRWTDAGEGRYVYVGDTRALVTPQLSAILDASLPAAIRDQLLAQLPAFMALFADRLGAVHDPLTVFVSYDTSAQSGWGRQGGVLPGQLSVHFYGAPWPEQMRKPGFADELAWHFAHEAAHVYQHQLYVDTNGDSWIHEGGAEAFAALAMRSGTPEARAYADARVARAVERCPQILGERSVRAAILAGESDAGYECGLTIALALDRAVRRAHPHTDGLYAIWRDYVARAGAGSGAGSVVPGSAELFVDCVERAGGAELANWVRRAVGEPRPTLDPPVP